MTAYVNRSRSSNTSFVGDARPTAAGDTPLPFSFEGDEDTGLFRPAADTVGFTAGGTEAFRYTATGVAFTGYTSVKTAAALTAAGTSRTDALALTSQLNFVATAALNTGVNLPSAATVGIGGYVSVFNAGANPIKVYAPGSDTIDGTAGSTGVTLTNAKRCEFYVSAAATWISAQLGVVSA